MDSVFCRACQASLHARQPICTACDTVQRAALPHDQLAAALFAMFLGGVGAHKFYVGKWRWGLTYLLLCWTLVPVLVSLVEGWITLSMSEKEFARRHLKTTRLEIGRRTRENLAGDTTAPDMR